MSDELDQQHFKIDTEDEASRSHIEKVARLALASAEPKGFTLLSPFADRHGVFEMRLVRSRESRTAFVSIACQPSPGTDALDCHITAGLAHDPHRKAPYTKRLTVRHIMAGADASLVASLRRVFSRAAALVQEPATLHATGVETAPQLHSA